MVGLSLDDALVRAGAVNSHQRDRSHREAFGLGLGYVLNPRLILTFDAVGGTSSLTALRVESATQPAVAERAGRQPLYLAPYGDPGGPVAPPVCECIPAGGVAEAAGRVHVVSGPLRADSAHRRFVLSDSREPLSGDWQVLGLRRWAGACRRTCSCSMCIPPITATARGPIR